MRFIKFLCLGALTLILTGCGGVNIQDYENTKPELKIEEYFQGRTTATGVFQDRFGKVRRRFTVDIEGDWDPENRRLTLKEDFVYDDGKTEQRVWEITKTGENSYEGTADKVVGKARGKTAGYAFNFNYLFDLSVDGNTWRVRFDDWMYLQPGGRILFNKATISKYGIRLGDVYIFFEKD